MKTGGVVRAGDGRGAGRRRPWRGLETAVVRAGDGRGAGRLHFSCSHLCTDNMTYSFLFQKSAVPCSAFSSSVPSWITPRCAGGAAVAVAPSAVCTTRVTGRSGRVPAARVPNVSAPNESGAWGGSRRTHLSQWWCAPSAFPSQRASLFPQRRLTQIGAGQRG